jgi:hypothetical protein
VTPGVAAVKQAGVRTRELVSCRGSLEVPGPDGDDDLVSMYAHEFLSIEGGARR